MQKILPPREQDTRCDQTDIEGGEMMFSQFPLRELPSRKYVANLKICGKVPKSKPYISIYGIDGAHLFALDDKDIRVLYLAIKTRMGYKK